MRVWILILFLDGVPQQPAGYYDTEPHCVEAAVRWQEKRPRRPPSRAALCESALLVEIDGITNPGTERSAE